MNYLSKNRLTDVPSEVCNLVALETLNLYHNCIRTIPDSIISLQSLTSLNLRHISHLACAAHLLSHSLNT
ncbi:leucine-rich repeat and calponin homology domain-containing protein 1 [Lates japonicus]|uniref:Leucine-rich repeat and calponin homology domain-containing protein 1 n=1 Tax=Lates japonicus TaxID=270547 RepID=A0AAD3NI17_LATJO|nr:leucine-rich repeat and calponin homology domain-containing protein 1 [Lates japonicus]